MGVGTSLCRQKEKITRINVGTYVKIILKKRNMTQAQLLNKMKQLKLADEKTLCRQHLNNSINIKMGYIWARRIEIALDLPDYTLINMIGKPTEAQWKIIKEVKSNV